MHSDKALRFLTVIESIRRPSADVGGPKVKRETSILDIIMGN